jgi:hypothetical protein
MHIQEPKRIKHVLQMSSVKADLLLVVSGPLSHTHYCIHTAQDTQLLCAGFCMHVSAGLAWTRARTSCCCQMPPAVRTCRIAGRIWRADR